MMPLAALLSLAIGVALGMLGGGGAILTLPMLVYAVGVEPKAAIATSLFVVGSTSLVGTVMNARSRTVEWRIGLLFGGAAMAGAFAGGRLASLVPATVLLLVFAVLMLVTAIAMLRGRAEPSGPPGGLALGRVLALGAGVGIVSGLVGAGGGFLIVPVLAMFGRLPMGKAIATSLFIITLQSFAGFAGHAGHAALDWSVIAVVTSASVAGMVAGTYAGRKVSANVLRRAFAWLVLAMGLFVIAKQVSIVVTALVAAITVTAVLLVTRARPALAE
jgi:uncharacterized membrane protein YfcA